MKMLAISIGANVGTTITAIIGSLSANIVGKRLAGAHLIFNLITAIVAIVFIQQLLISVDWIGDKIHLTQDNYTLKFAIFHTLFNLIGVILVIPFVKPLVKFLEWALTEKEPLLKQPKYLNQAVLESRHATIAAVRSESIRLYDLSLKVIAYGIGLNKVDLIEAVDEDNISLHNKALPGKNINLEYEVRIKQVFSAIIEFVIITRDKYSDSYGKALQIYSKAVRELALSIKGIKHLQKNLLANINSDNEVIKFDYNQLLYRWYFIDYGYRVYS
ncbi:MAG: Na/Pi cotransporter family protein [Alcanivoracaceae bacterium]|nr:Na/Pi cotransporter family protein [Alcanivoracaceae bacterium]